MMAMTSSKTSSDSRKTEALRRDILAWEPRVERGGMSWREVKRRAGIDPRTRDGSHTQMLRLVENYIRHELTDYDEFLEAMKLKHGGLSVRETFWFCLDRVTPKILEAFPELQFRNPRNAK